ncbi:gliding motility lipoprotein GldB [Winogradskyella aurantia]|uniref:Gliding motility lipoprotein GldB n=2 Tax=Winogradskyella aurantia TaxID=1915063 RepID=A0A265UPW4_9FLAO|nr:gliding motility lipoprotein GldB [Winogradskyella aurantia]
MLGLKMFCMSSLRIMLALAISLFCWSCDEDSKIEEEISKVNVNFGVERFDSAFQNASPKDLPKLKMDYPFLFSKHIADSIWVKRITDSLQNELLAEVSKEYSNFAKTKAELNQLFQHLKFYDKTFAVPRVVTLTNDVAYRDKTIVTDTIILIALDNYLGQDHRFYQNIPKYITANMEPKNIVLDVAEGYAKKYISQIQRKRFLDEMIYQGKLLYFKDVMIPFKTDFEKIGYTADQLKWAEANEDPIWSYFVERELLYSTDGKLVNRFIADAPFSKFYLELDNESPGRLGQYIGWQIVKAYAERTGEDLFKILATEPEEIFIKSKFKPKK